MHQNTTFYEELNGEHAGEGFMPLHSAPAVAQNRDQLNQGRQRWNHVLTGVVNSTETDFEHYFYVYLIRRGENWGGKHTAYDLFSE